MSLSQSSLSVVLLACLSTSVHAGFTAAVTPSFSGTPCARKAGFETFTHAYNGANVPDVAGTDELGATITQLIPGAILTSGGNIYHPFQATAFRLTDTATADVQEVVLQTSTFGNSRDVGSFTLTYVGSNGQDVVLAPTEFLPLVQISQQHDELYFRWDLSGVNDTVLAYRLEWVAIAPNMSLDAVLLDVRLECGAGTVFCSGDGSAAACPCGNMGAIGNGCASSVNPAGATLTASGMASLSNDTLKLQGSGMPDTTCIYIQGSNKQSQGLGAVFGDGLRCAGGSVKRIGTASNSAGSSTYPGVSQAPVSVRGSITTAGTQGYYQVWYRNAAAFCTSSTFNLSNGYQVGWIP